MYHFCKLNILGQEYNLITKKYNEDPAFKNDNIIGYQRGLTKQIVICDPHSHPDYKNEPEEIIEELINITLRHEIVHAFLDESGLRDNAFAYDGSWSRNEEMVDWIALQGPKIYAAWMAAKAI